MKNINLDVHSWPMFRGNPQRTGVSRSKPITRPSLLWVTEVGPTISSPVFDKGSLYVATVTGRIFALNFFERVKTLAIIAFLQLVEMMDILYGMSKLQEMFFRHLV